MTWGIGVGWCREEFEAIGTDAVRRARRRHRRDDRGLPRAVDQREPAASDGKYVEFSNIFFQPRPVQKPCRRSGSAARAARRCAAPRGSATPGIRSAPTRATGSTRWSASRPGWSGCAAWPRGRPRPSKIVKLAYRFSQFGHGHPGARRQRRAAARSPATTRRSSPICGRCAISASIAVDFSFDGDTADAVIANMRRFREDVLAKV